MQPVGLTITRETTRPGPVPYSSDKIAASITLDLGPGDSIEDATRLAHDIVARALTNQTPTTQAAPPPVAPSRTTFLVEVTGFVPREPQLRALKFRWASDRHVAEYQTKAEAENSRKALLLIRESAKVTITTPQGVTM